MSSSYLVYFFLSLSFSRAAFLPLLRFLLRRNGKNMLYFLATELATSRTRAHGEKNARWRSSTRNRGKESDLYIPSLSSASQTNDREKRIGTSSIFLFEICHADSSFLPSTCFFLILPQRSFSVDSRCPALLFLHVQWQDVNRHWIWFISHVTWSRGNNRWEKEKKRREEKQRSKRKYWLDYSLLDEHLIRVESIRRRHDSIKGLSFVLKKASINRQRESKRIWNLAEETLRQTGLGLKALTCVIRIIS